MVHDDRWGFIPLSVAAVQETETRLRIGRYVRLLVYSRQSPKDKCRPAQGLYRLRRPPVRCEEQGRFRHSYHLGFRFAPFNKLKSAEQKGFLVDI
jgi:hypothetical protein